MEDVRKLYEENKHDDVIKAVKQMEKQAQGDAYAYLLAGKSYYYKNKPKDSLKYLEKSFDMGGDKKEIYYFMGKDYALMRKYDKAIEKLNEALTIDPEDANVLLTWGLFTL